MGGPGERATSHWRLRSNAPGGQCTPEKMHMTRCMTLALLCIGAPLAAQRPALPPDSVLRAIEARGRALAVYDEASWHATDAVLELKPAEGLVTHYIGRPMADGWTVSFGRLAADSSSFLVAFEARSADWTRSVRAAAVTPPRPDTGYLLRAARAVTAARADFGTPSRPYNVAVLPDDSAGKGGSGWYVYLFPAVTTAGIWPHGADVRYRVSADGKRIIEKRRLHNAVIESGSPDGQPMEAGFHTAILDDIVEDTDVALVLMRRPRVPELIVTRSYLFRISADGRIAVEVR